ncbi:MFS transporter [Alteromonas aestuariivivens]|uniref:MFS transporter n=1 Tax=Alteromonas aestuariivivens TaxID=1938339 RepID=A0A3D8M570_9ALTE|nr:MFS transporter [Alteromonas aestuariivivens]RDV24883.1 MFS transporter [Alteromonas aestuariivivens]
MNRRPITIVIFAGFFLFGMLFLLWGILLSDIAADLGMNKVVSGALFTLFSLGTVLGAVVGGKYVSRFDFLALLAVLTSIDAVLLLIFSAMQHWVSLLAVIFLVGVVSSCIITIGHTLIARLYVEKRFAMMGIMDFMFSLGTLAASFYVTLVYFYLPGWRWPIRLLTIFMALLAVYTFFAAMRSRAMVATQPREVKRSLSYKEVLRRPVFVLLALVSFGYGAVEFGNANWFVTYAQLGRGVDGETARNLLACFTAGMVVSRLVFAYFLRIFSLHRLTVIMAVMSGIGTWGIATSETMLMLGVSNLLFGLGLGGLYPLVLSAAMNIDSEKGPVLSGVSIIGNSLGVQTASFSIGLWANYAPITQAYWVIPIGGGILMLTAWLYSRELKAL